MPSHQTSLALEIQRVRARRKLLAAEDELVPSTLVGLRQLKRKWAAEAAVAKARNQQLLQHVQSAAAASQDTSNGAAVNVLLTALRASYLSLVEQSLPAWYEQISQHLLQQHNRNLSYPPQGNMMQQVQQRQQHSNDATSAAIGLPAQQPQPGACVEGNVLQPQHTKYIVTAPLIIQQLLKSLRMHVPATNSSPKMASAADADSDTHDIYGVAASQQPAAQQLAVAAATACTTVAADSGSKTQGVALLQQLAAQQAAVPTATTKVTHAAAGGTGNTQGMSGETTLQHLAAQQAAAAQAAGAPASVSLEQLTSNMADQLSLLSQLMMMQQRPQLGLGPQQRQQLRLQQQLGQDTSRWQQLQPQQTVLPLQQQSQRAQVKAALQAQLQGQESTAGSQINAAAASAPVKPCVNMAAEATLSFAPGQSDNSSHHSAKTAALPEEAVTNLVTEHKGQQEQQLSALPAQQGQQETALPVQQRQQQSPALGALKRVEQHRPQQQQQQVPKQGLSPGADNEHQHGAQLWLPESFLLSGAGELSWVPVSQAAASTAQLQTLPTMQQPTHLEQHQHEHLIQLGQQSQQPELLLQPAASPVQVQQPLQLQGQQPVQQQQHQQLRKEQEWPQQQNNHHQHQQWQAEEGHGNVSAAEPAACIGSLITADASAAQPLRARPHSKKEPKVVGVTNATAQSPTAASGAMQADSGNSNVQNQQAGSGQQAVVAAGQKASSRRQADEATRNAAAVMAAVNYTTGPAEEQGNDILWQQMASAAAAVPVTVAGLAAAVASSPTAPAAVVPPAPAPAPPVSPAYESAAATAEAHRTASLLLTHSQVALTVTSLDSTPAAASAGVNESNYEWQPAEMAKEHIFLPVAAAGTISAAAGAGPAAAAAAHGSAAGTSALAATSINPSAAAATATTAAAAMAAVTSIPAASIAALGQLLALESTSPSSSCQYAAAQSSGPLILPSSSTTSSRKLGISSLAVGLGTHAATAAAAAAGLTALAGSNAITGTAGAGANGRGGWQHSGPIGGSTAAGAVMLSPATRLSLGAVGYDAGVSGRLSLSTDSEAAVADAASRLSLGAASTASSGAAGPDARRSSLSGGGREGLAALQHPRLQASLKIPAGAEVPGSTRSSIGGNSSSSNARHADNVTGNPVASTGIDADAVVKAIQQGQLQAASEIGPTNRMPVLQIARALEAKQQQQQQEGSAGSSKVPAAAVAKQDNFCRSVSAAAGRDGGAGTVADKGKLVSKVLTTGFTDFGDSDSEDCEGSKPVGTHKSLAEDEFDF